MRKYLEMNIKSRELTMNFPKQPPAVLTLTTMVHTR